MKSIKYGLVFVLLSMYSMLGHAEIDWNAEKIQWLHYEEGLQTLNKTKEVGLIVLYADWCSTCKAYANLFKMQKVVAALDGVTIIKANAEKEEGVTHLKEYDQKYIPKTIIIDGSGDVVTQAYGEKEDFMFFLPPEDADALLAVIALVKEINAARKH